MCRGHGQPPAFAPQPPAFAPGTSKVAVVFFGLFVSFVQNLPQLHMHGVVFSPIHFLRILLLEKRFVQGQALQQRVQVPGLSQHRCMD